MQSAKQEKQPEKKETEGTQNAAITAAEIVGTDLLEDLDAPEKDQAPDNEDDASKNRRTNGSQNSEKSLLKRVESTLRIFSLVAISASAVLATYQYYQGRIDKRKEASVTLMNEWQASPERAAYASLKAALEERLKDGTTVYGQVTPAALEKFKETIKYETGKAMVLQENSEAGTYEGWPTDVEMLFNFYSRVEFCISANLCYAPLLQAYFGEDATDFWSYYEFYAEQRRDTFYPDYGRAVETFVKEVGR